ncbi:MAG: hypothetical protein O2917_08330, partial [Acidobacteria bacterium]|nr:hypothetical protein [Acidobacteriota bacterium]
MTAPASFTLRHLPRVVAVLLGTVLAFGVFGPSPVVEAGDKHRAKMSPEFAAKLASQSADLFQVVLTAPQSVVDRLGRQYGLRLVKRMIAGGVFEGTVDQISNLAGDTQVGSLEENRRVYSMAAVTAQSIGADQVWKGVNGSSFGGTTGRGVGIAVLDSGIGNHPDLRNRVSARLDFTGPNGV